MPKGIYMFLLAPTRMPTLQIEKGLQMVDTWVFKHTGKAGDDKNGNATIVIQLEETEKLNCELKDGHGDTFSVR